MGGRYLRCSWREYRGDGAATREGVPLGRRVPGTAFFIGQTKRPSRRHEESRYLAKLGDTVSNLVSANAEGRVRKKRPGPGQRQKTATEDGDGDSNQRQGQRQSQRQVPRPRLGLRLEPGPRSEKAGINPASTRNMVEPGLSRARSRKPSWRPLSGLRALAVQLSSCPCRIRMTSGFRKQISSRS